MNKNKLKEFQKILEDRKIFIQKQLNENTEGMQGLYNSEPNDSADFSTIDAESQIEQTINKNLRQELSDIELSLNKIKKENYGYCELCGEDIHPERLKFKPHAKYCINCREIIEKEIKQ